MKTHDLPSLRGLLASHSVRRILKNSDLSIPTSIIPWKRTFATHLRLAHFSENLFNVTVIWSNAEVRQKEGFESGGDVLYGLDEHFKVEWVHGDEGLAFKDGFWERRDLILVCLMGLERIARRCGSKRFKKG